MNVFLVAIDGPAGSGKTTVSRQVAERLGLRHVDTGAMYRCLAHKLLSTGASESDSERLHGLLASTSIEIEDGRVILDGIPVDQELRTPEVSRASSVVAQDPVVRAWMVNRQKTLMHVPPGAVAEGRDIGTVVAPDADLKIFLVAEPQVRAERRAKETGEDPGSALEHVNERDRRDQEREHSPLSMAEGAVVIDTSQMTTGEVVEAVVALAKERLAR